MVLLKQSVAINPAVVELLPRIRHTYRSLLREATYLADASARNYFRGYIGHRFNPFNPEKLDKRYWGTNKFRNEIKVEKVENGLKDANIGLRTLMYANSGNLEALEKVLMRAYGRSGRRRRELLANLLRASGEDLPQDETALQQFIDARIAKKQGRAPVTDNSTYKMPKMMRHFVANQQANQPATSERGKIKRLSPTLPEENIWGRSLPKKRAANIEKRFLADILSRILPPLPAHEWDRLESLALGRMPLEEPPPRRIKSNDELKAYELDTVALSKRFLTPSRAKKSSTTPTDHHNPDGRPLRRLYGKIWRLSAKMVRGEHTKELTITWGQDKSPAGAGLITQPSEIDMGFFEGLDVKEGSAPKAGKHGSK
ncbi:hypothetical protein ACMFMF_000233 [Clarireedia jacksonii]